MQMDASECGLTTPLVVKLVTKSNKENKKLQPGTTTGTDISNRTPTRDLREPSDLSFSSGTEASRSTKDACVRKANNLAERERDVTGRAPSNGSEPDFIPLGTESGESIENTLESSDVLSERARVQFDKLRWLKERGGEMVNGNEVWLAHHLVRTELGLHTGRGRPPNHGIVAGMKDGASDRVWPEAKRWRKGKRRYFARKDAALGEDSSSWVNRNLRDPPTPTSETSSRREAGSVNTDSPIFLRSSDPQDFVRDMTAPIRFCIFNTGPLTKNEVWKILKDRMNPEVLDGVIRVQLFRQPNGYPRTDIWIEARVAAGIKRGLYLTAKQRRVGTMENYKYPLYKLAWLWMPNAQTSHWRIDVHKTWRDRRIHRIPEKKQDAIRTPRAIGTLNINGMGAKRPELINFLKTADIGILAVQETLLDRNKYNFYLPGYEIYNRRKDRMSRGQMLLVHRNYPSYEIKQDEDASFIHIKVAKLGSE
ncbi:hypothetical protein BU15DRAFT_69620, partial [Melanogaster broomeanus]